LEFNNSKKPNSLPAIKLWQNLNLNQIESLIIAAIAGVALFVESEKFMRLSTKD
jgi:hypothetical protein